MEDEVTYCYNEAKDNAKFIQALEKCCHCLYLDDPVRLLKYNFLENIPWQVLFLFLRCYCTKDRRQRLETENYEMYITKFYKPCDIIFLIKLALANLVIIFLKASTFKSRDNFSESQHL